MAFFFFLKKLFIESYCSRACPRFYFILKKKKKLGSVHLLNKSKNKVQTLFVYKKKTNMNKLLLKFTPSLFAINRK